MSRTYKDTGCKGSGTWCGIETVRPYSKWQNKKVRLLCRKHLRRLEEPVPTKDFKRGFFGYWLDW